MNIETAHRLVTLRKKHGYSQEALASELNISRQAISKWERAESSPDTDNLIALSKLYNISLDALLDTDDESFEDEQYARKAEQAGKDTEQQNNVAHIQKKKKRKTKASRWYDFPVALPIVAIYFLLGFFTGKWCGLLFLFLCIPIYYLTVTFFHYREKNTRNK